MLILSDIRCIKMEEVMESMVKPKKLIYFLRQLMVCSGVWTTFFMAGQFIGAPTVVVPQLRKEPTMSLGDEMASWLYSATGFATVPWVIILSVVTKRYGFKVAHIAACVDLLLTYVIFYFSTSPLQILISEIVFGVGKAAAMTIGIVIVSEYTSPKYRGVFLTIKSASFSWGIWSANAIGTFFHWKYIAFSGFLCSAYTFSFVFWPESPQWLARKGRFDECRKAYYWLQGHDEKTEKEVEELISSRMKVEQNARLTKDWSSLSAAIKTVASKEFYGPFLLTALLITQYHFSGKLVCAIYVIDILKKMTNSESTAYMGMLILDGVTLFSMYFGCFLSKILKRRTLYFTSSLIGISFLFIISLYLYLVKLNVIVENTVLSIALLTCYSIAMSCGPMIMSTAIYVELIPLRYKLVMVLMASILFFSLSSALLKIAPYLFKSLGLYGFFLLEGVTAAACTMLLYKYLPETKDKTLQEIEKNFKTNNISGSEMEKLRNNIDTE